MHGQSAIHGKIVVKFLELSAIYFAQPINENMILLFEELLHGSSTGVGMEAIEGLRFLVSLPLAGTGRTEGGKKTQPFNRFHGGPIRACRLFQCRKETWRHQISMKLSG